MRIFKRFMHSAQQKLAGQKLAVIQIMFVNALNFRESDLSNSFSGFLFKILEILAKKGIRLIFALCAF